MTVAVAAPAPEDGGEEVVLDYVLCRCGRLAALLLVAEELDVYAAVKCACGAFAVPDAAESPS